MKGKCGKDVGVAERRTGEGVLGAQCWRPLQEQVMEVQAH